VASLMAEIISSLVTALLQIEKATVFGVAGLKNIRVLKNI
jgi:hypothetical protein